MKQITIDVRGFQFDAYEAGPDSGPLVLLLHGFPQSAWAFRHQVEALGQAGYHAVAPDQRGYSAGARPLEVEAYASGEMVDDALAFADHFGAEKFHLLGHDWGAGVAWTLAGHHGHRLITLTALSVPHPFAFSRAIAGEAPADGTVNDQGDRSSYFAVFASLEAEDIFLADDASMLETMFTTTGLSANDARYYTDRMRNRPALTAALNWYRAAFQSPEVTMAAMASMQPITMPTLYVWSTEDPALGKLGADLNGEYMAGPYTYVVLEGVGHWISEQVPDRLTELLLTHLASVDRPPAD